MSDFTKSKFRIFATGGPSTPVATATMIGRHVTIESGPCSQLMTNRIWESEDRLKDIIKGIGHMSSFSISSDEESGFIVERI